jgi:hypothetical protein
VARTGVRHSPCTKTVELVQRAGAPLAASSHSGPGPRAAPVAGGRVLGFVPVVWVLDYSAGSHFVQPVGGPGRRVLGLLGGPSHDSRLGTLAERKFEHIIVRVANFILVSLLEIIDIQRPVSLFLRFLSLTCTPT